MSSVVYGVGGYRPAHPSQGRILFADDITSTVITWNDAGTQTSTRPYTAQEIAQVAVDTAAQAQITNRSTIEQRATAALAANATYLAVASPTNAQNLAQIRTLTRECSGIIRLLLNQLETTDGT
jgi:hypothetical protein